MLSRFLFALVLMLFIIPSWAAPGDFDTSFGGGAGWVSTPFTKPDNDQARSVIQQADGKLVVAGRSYNGSNWDFALVRYNADDTLDTSFNGTGKLTTTVGVLHDYANSVIQQADGKLVVAGYSTNGGINNSDFELVRVNSDGTLDTTFSGDGKLTTAIGVGNDIAYSVIQQADGKLVAAGSSRNGSYDNFALVRYNSDGTLDTTFNGTGKLITAIGASTTDIAYSVIQQADGKLVVAGASSGDFALVRYNSDGSLDTTFNATGKLTTDIGLLSNDLAYSVIQQADGKLVAAGYSTSSGGNADFALVRYNSDGWLDATFNGTGKLTTVIAGDADQATSVIQQVDGKLVAAGWSSNGINNDFALVRYNSNGSLDTTFSGDGRQTADIGESEDLAYSVIQQADGKLAAAGYSTGSTNDNDFALVRVNSNGTLDTTFDTDGKLLTNIAETSQAQARSVIQQADGKLVVAGYNGSSNADFALMRYNSNGALDTTFNGTGKLATVIYASSTSQATSLIQQADGKLVVAGTYYYYGNAAFALVRYNIDGSLDTTFSGDGKLITSIGTSNVPNSVIQQADGKLVVAGSSSNGSNTDFALVRYNSDGSLDTTFSGTGKLTTAIGLSADQAYSVIQQANGKLVVAGKSSNGSNDDFALVRYNSDGSLDTTFNGTGKLTTAIGVAADQANSVIQQADGKLVVAGYSRNGSSNDDFALARYNSDGSLDTTFNGTGKLTTAIGVAADQANSVIQQADGKLVVAGYSRNGSGNDDFALARYNSNGTMDTTFNGTGKRTVALGTAADLAYSLIQQADGKLAVAGYSTGMPTGSEFVAARFESGQLDTDGDGFIDGLDTDDDNDGVADISDAFPLDATESVDTDGDGIGNNADTTPNGDTDNDGIDNAADNCVSVSNADQLNTDGDGAGDVCDATPNGDTDNDGIDNAIDNCVAVSNADQLNTDNDTQGDACDTDDDNDNVADVSDAFPLDVSESADTDGDGIGDNADTTPNGDTDNDGIDNAIDNCVAVSNADQLNTDGDTQGNECDNDDDNDGVADISDAFPLDASESVDTDGDGTGDNADVTPNGDTDSDGIDNAVDNCVSVSNADQLNTDGDTQGNECDNDDDNDGVADISDAFPLDNSESVDADGDGIGDNADTTPNGDTDNDTVDNAADNCVSVSNVDQLNTDGDAEGDACDTDDDNDGVADAVDNCSLNVNADQLNADSDAQGNICDVDDDNDSVADISDNCQLIANSNQLDYDADNIGDACDDAVPLPEDIAGVMKNAKAGSAVAFAGDVNGDGYGDYVIGMPGYDIPAAPPVTIIKDAGRAEVISGKTGAVLMSVNGVAAKDAMGFAVAGNDDIDNDGFDDVVVGAPNADDTEKGIKKTGAVTLLYGPNGERRRPFFGTEPKSQFGYAVSVADANGDGHADILIGAPKDNDVWPQTKKVGSVSLFSGEDNSLLAKWYGGISGWGFGSSVLLADLDADAVAEIVVGSPYGRYSLTSGSGDGTAMVSTASSWRVVYPRSGKISVYGLAEGYLWDTGLYKKNALFGSSLAAADVDADGKNELIVGAPGYVGIDNEGNMAAGSVSVISGNVGSEIWSIFGEPKKSGFGLVVSAGDVNGDGHDDIIVGAPKATKNTGYLKVWDGNSYSLIATLYGEKKGDLFGAAISAGDINSDGKSDLIIGIPGFDALPMLPATKSVKEAGGVKVFSGGNL